MSSNMNQDFDSLESKDPTSRKECIDLTKFTLSRIFMESFGESVFLAGDEKTGFRFGFMSFELQEKNNDR